MITALFTLIIYLLVFGVIWWAVDYLIASLPIPDPPARFIRIAMVILFALLLVTLLLGIAGVNTGVNLPRLG
jgi:hypothetical protein